MADSKISQLTALTAIDVAGSDVLPIVDTSATTTKKVSAADIAEYVSTSSAITNLVSPKANSASPTLTGTVTLAVGASIEGASGTPVAIHGIELPTGHQIRFEGSTANDFETFLTVVDPTADRTVTFQDATGTVALTSDSQNDQFVLASAIFNS